MPNKTKSNFLCNLCNDIFADSSYEWWANWHSEWRLRLWSSLPQMPQMYPRQHHPSYEEFTNAVTQGCWLCVHLGKQIAKHRPEKLEAAGFKVLHYRFECDPSGYRFPDPWFSLHFESDRNSDKFLIKPIRTGTALHQLAETSKLHPSTGDESVAELAKGWLTRCQNQHLNCAKHVEVNWHPTRLLDVSTEPVRLRISSDSQITGPYAALSHCWGTERFWVLSKDTMSQLLEGVPLSEMPNTFQHAITTIRRLGIDYLWIDCYCIIQGLDPLAKTDWEYEASRMSQVYSNAVITIGAAQASSPNQGLFSTRGTEDFKAISVRWRPTRLNRQESYILRNDTLSEPLCDAFFELNRSRLAERAWSVQESVLSPRMLSFNGPEVFWQCSEAAACGDYPDDEVKDVVWALNHPFWTLTDSDHLLRNNRLPEYEKRRRIQSFGQRDNVSIHERWFATMGDYCKASLTFPDKDVFKAIEGVGQCMALLMGDVYQHGLLRNTLPCALMWEAKYKECRRSPPQRAPTWHWASYEARLEFSSAGFLCMLARDKEFTVTPVAYVFMSDDCRTFASDIAKDLWPSLMCICRPIMLNLEYSDPSYRFHTRSSHIKVSSTLDYEVEVDDSVDCFALLPLMSTQREESLRARHFMPNSIQGLLIRATGNGRYQRVGYFKDYDLKLLEPLKTTKPTLIVME